MGASTFVSLGGRFSISLPNHNGFAPLTIPTPFGNARGNAYQWQAKEATFGIGFADAAEPLNDPETLKQFFNGATELFKTLATANNGNVAAVRQITLDSYPGIEQRANLFTGSIIQRTYIVSRRIYEIVAVVNNSQRVYETIAVGVLDSFKVLSEAEVKTKQAKAEPTPFPQTPVPQRAGSDASDEGLRGHIKSVLIESEAPSGGGRKRDSLDIYNTQGNLIRSESYDDQGKLLSIKLYGYLDGNRVAKVTDLESDPRDIRVTVTPPPGTKKFDPRFENRYEFKYDDKKRLTEKTEFLNNGDVWIRTVYKYKKDQKEQLDYSGDGSLSQRIVYTLDDKGNEIQETVFYEDGVARYVTSYIYEFDAKGNWTKRTTSTVEITDGRRQPLPRTIEFRTITYY